MKATLTEAVNRLWAFQNEMAEQSFDPMSRYAGCDTSEFIYRAQEAAFQQLMTAIGWTRDSLKAAIEARTSSKWCYFNFGMWL